MKAAGLRKEAMAMRAEFQVNRLLQACQAKSGDMLESSAQPNPVVRWLQKGWSFLTGVAGQLGEGLL